MKSLLILGGTAEARMLAEAVTSLHGSALRVITSWAGRTERAPNVVGETRVGGFGGTAGLVEYLEAEAIDMVVESTHPFAKQISDHTYDACIVTGLPRMLLVRPEWRLPPSKNWVEVADLAAAAETVRENARRAFVTTGKQTINAFSAVKGVFFLVRLLKKPSVPLTFADYEITTGWPPFSLEAEKVLMKEHRIDALISKSSGGALPAKITAALELDLPIVLVPPPPPPPGECAKTLPDCLAWIAAHM